MDFSKSSEKTVYVKALDLSIKACIIAIGEYIDDRNSSIIDDANMVADRNYLDENILWRLRES